MPYESNLELGCSPKSLSVIGIDSSGWWPHTLQYLVGIEQDGKSYLDVCVNFTIAARTRPRKPPSHGDEATD